jgi:DNA-binding response OmpR family regulator
MARVLVIDDDVDLRKTIRKMLQLDGYDVVEADDGRSGIESFRTKPANLVITDILMPGQEGIETITALRRHDPKVKILAISGGGRTGRLDFLDIAKKFGADDSLAKPFRSRELLERVQKLLNAT